jgi:hypothetical protein
VERLQMADFHQAGFGAGNAISTRQTIALAVLLCRRFGLCKKPASFGAVRADLTWLNLSGPEHLDRT